MEPALLPPSPTASPTFLWVEPGAFQGIRGFSYFEVSEASPEDDPTTLMKAVLVRSGLLETYEENCTMEVPMGKVRSNAVSAAEARDGPRTMLGATVCTKRAAPTCRSAEWVYGTVSSCEWDESTGMASYHLVVEPDEVPTVIQCASSRWIIVDLYCYSLRPYHRHSSLLIGENLIREQHARITDCLSSGGKSTHWDGSLTIRRLKDIVGEHWPLDLWARIPIFDFKSCKLIWRSISRCMDFAYYVEGSRHSVKARSVPRSLLEPTPEVAKTTAKRKTAPAVGTPRDPRRKRAFVMSDTPVDDAFDSEDDFEAAAVANSHRASYRASAPASAGGPSAS